VLEKKVKRETSLEYNWDIPYIGETADTKMEVPFRSWKSVERDMSLKSPTLVYDAVPAFSPRKGGKRRRVDSIDCLSMCSLLGLFDTLGLISN
jgi:hypothetical protein